MRAVIAKRARVARVRRIQHVQAQGEVAQAEGRAASLENSAARLAALRASLDPAPGRISGATLAHAGELGMRLEAARDGLGDAIASAHARVAEKAALRLEARIRQESAERLGQRAVAAWAAERERRAPVPRRRPAGDERTGR